MSRKNLQVPKKPRLNLHMKTFLDTGRMMELVQNVAYYNMVVRMLVPLGVELEPGSTRD